VPGTHPAPPPGAPSPTDFSDAALAHFLGLLGFLGPLIIMMSRGERSRWVRDNAVEAVNFHLSFMIYTLVGGFLLTVVTCVTLGFGAILFVLLFVPWTVTLVCSIMAGTAAQRGRFYRYPMTIRMIK